MKVPLKRRGDVIGPYVIQGFLGSGGEGDVFLAQHSRTGVLRSVKLLRGRDMLSQAEHTVACYRRLAGVRSVKQLRGWGTLDKERAVGKRPWLAFDYVDGVTLARQIALGQIKEPLAMVHGLCLALVPVHRRGMVIGDLDRGRNVLIERGSDLVKFCDLDAGVPQGRPPSTADDLWELVWLARAAYRRRGKAAPGRLLSSLQDAATLDEAMRRLPPNEQRIAPKRPPP